MASDQRTPQGCGQESCKEDLWGTLLAVLAQEEAIKEIGDLKMEIRDFSPKDRGAFIEMCVAFYSSGAANCSLSEAAMSRTFEATIAKSPFLRGLILEEAGEVLGYGHVSFTYANEADGLVMFIEEVYIKPEYQGRGLGTQFLQWLFAEYKGRVKWYELEVDQENQGALKLYERLGFQGNDYVHLKLVGDDLKN